MNTKAPEAKSSAYASAAQLNELYRAARSGVLARGLWGLFYAREKDGEFQFGGFAIPPRALPMRLRFFVNEIECPVIEQPDDPTIVTIAARFGLRGAHQQFSFRCALPMRQLGDATTFRVEFRPGSAIELSRYQDWHVRLDLGLQADTARRVRVARTEDGTMFESMGCSASAAMRRALAEFFKRDYSDCKSILDWGCGCGRVARFVAALAPGRLTGIDIDSDNVGWCKENISGARFEPIELNPPTRFAAGAFDFVYGISVFTHLSASDQDLWLAELHRITSPGAALIMSTHGELAFCRSDSDVDRFLALQEDGFLVYGVCDDLDDVVPEVKELSYYKNVFHSRGYIYEHWSRYFEIIEVLDAAMGGHQDAVVMRRRND